MEDLISIKRHLIAIFDAELEGYKPEGTYARAAYFMLTRAKSELECILLLIEKGFVVEAAIIARSLMNLNWNFLYLTNAKRIDGKFRFNEKPTIGSAEVNRAERFLSWHWVELFSRNKESDKVKKMIQQLKLSYGYAHDADIPKHWWKESKKETLRDLSIKVEAEPQYLEDYAFLSGLEHSSITACILQQMEDGEGTKGRRFIVAKALQQFAFILECVLLIVGKSITPDFQALISEISAKIEQLKHLT